MSNVRPKASENYSPSLRPELYEGCLIYDDRSLGEVFKQKFYRQVGWWESRPTKDHQPRTKVGSQKTSRLDLSVSVYFLFFFVQAHFSSKSCPS